MPVPKEIVSYCSSLVLLTVNARGKEEAVLELQLAHLSVKDYLLSNRVPQSFAKDFKEATARASITQVYLAYLLELDGNLPVEKVRQSYWLAEYSAQYWMHHAVVVDSGSRQLCALIKEFFSREDAWTICYTLYDPDRPEGKYTQWVRCGILSALYYASLGGSCFSVQLLLDKNSELNSYQVGHGTILHAAMRNGHDKIVQILLKKRAKVNARGGTYHTALVAASYHGHDKVVKVLLDNNADINAQGSFRGSALYAAADKGHDQVVQMLLNEGADVHARGGDYANALQAASYHGHEKIVQRLLGEGANVDAQERFYGNALKAALARGHDKIAQMLRDSGARTESEASD
ncbi:ankyrin repeat-containing domain protein [Trichoderma pleuroticola]